MSQEQGAEEQEEEQEENSTTSDSSDTTSNQVNSGSSFDVDAFVDKVERIHSTVVSDTNNCPTVQPLSEGRLHRFQLRGFQWLCCLHRYSLGGILADEMGLGKTIQTLAFLQFCYSSASSTPGDTILPSLIVVPLTLLSNWEREIQRFTPSLSLLTFYSTSSSGSSDVRAVETLYRSVSACARAGQVIILTTYEYLNTHINFLSSFTWDIVVLDEGHRLKNSHTLIHRNCSSLSVRHTRLILTGTPVQNSLMELHTLLHFVNPLLFPHDYSDFLCAVSFSASSDGGGGVDFDRLKDIIAPFVLRREKEEVLTDALPPLRHYTLYSNLSLVQRDVYLAILRRDINSIIESGTSDNRRRHVSLNNILVQLRKCVDHPYLFAGIEPEPFQAGDHLIDASGKLALLDRLLAYLHSHGHRVLVFSQLTSMLDILQDYLEYRGYSYCRLDGSIRGGERAEQIDSFAASDRVFVFLLSTRAGGLGLNLTMADTVILYDSDFNPQIDMQAAARVHRIGQLKEVMVIRMIVRGTVEEVILKRAEAKAALARNVLSGATDAGIDQPVLSESVLYWGLKEVLAMDSADSEKVEEMIDFDAVFGKGSFSAQSEMEGEARVDSIYQFEGRDYFHVESADRSAAQDLVDASLSIRHDPFRKAASSMQLSYEQLEVQRREESIAAAKKREERKLKLWAENGYASTSLPLPCPEFLGSQMGRSQIHHVYGCVAEPRTTSVGNGGPSIIACCADNSGQWTDRGVFKSLSQLCSQISEAYAQASEMKDLHVGDAHWIPIDGGRTICVLLIAQKRTKQGTSDVGPKWLESALCRLAYRAHQTNSTVHLPQLGRRSDGSFYELERVIGKTLCRFGIETFMYYFSRKMKQKRDRDEHSIADADFVGSKKQKSDLFDGVAAVFFPVEYEDDRELVSALEPRIRKRGGTIKHSVNDSDVTHLVVLSYSKEASRICDHLKLKGVKVVIPDWVIDSLVAGRLEDEDEYLYIWHN